MSLLDRITTNPEQMAGVACVRGLRVPVATVLEMLSQGMTEQAILADYPYLESEDIRACLKYAAQIAQERILPLDLAS